MGMMPVSNTTATSYPIGKNTASASKYLSKATWYQYTAAGGSEYAAKWFLWFQRPNEMFCYRKMVISVEHNDCPAM